MVHFREATWKIRSLGLIPVAFAGVLGSVYVFAFRSMSREEREESYRPAWYEWYRQHRERRLASKSDTRKDDS